jgi:hypothetical protein
VLLVPHPLRLGVLPRLVELARLVILSSVCLGREGSDSRECPPACCVRLCPPHRSPPCGISGRIPASGFGASRVKCTTQAPPLTPLDAPVIRLSSHEGGGTSQRGEGAPKHLVLLLRTVKRAYSSCAPFAALLGAPMSLAKLWHT